MGIEDWKKVDEGVYCKKGKYGHSLIYPVKKDITKKLGKGNVDWKNVWGLRNKKSWFMTAFILILVIGSVWAYNTDIATYKDIAEHPWKYYYFCNEPVDWTNPLMGLNISNETIKDFNIKDFEE